MSIAPWGRDRQEAASAAALLRDFSTYEKPKETAAPLDMQSYKDAMLRGLRQQLPDYMVPSDLMLATDFPLTANGKLDRQNYSCRANKLPTSVTAWVQSRWTVRYNSGWWRSGRRYSA